MYTLSPRRTVSLLPILSVGPLSPVTLIVAKLLSDHVSTTDST